METLILSFFSLITSLFFVIVFIILGWYIVWKLFLSRFKFVRELLGRNDSESPKNRPLSSRTRLRRQD